LVSIAQFSPVNTLSLWTRMEILLWNKLYWFSKAVSSKDSRFRGVMLINRSILFLEIVYFIFWKNKKLYYYFSFYFLFLTFLTNVFEHDFFLILV
jgi:hypothetical protein